MKRQILIIIVLFLALIPFRLPISILFIQFFEWIIGATTRVTIPQNVLSVNVILTKLIYNVAISTGFIYNVEMFSRDKMKRKAKSANEECALYWWCVPIIIFLFVFIIADLNAVNDIFFPKQKQ